VGENISSHRRRHGNLMQAEASQPTCASKLISSTTRARLPTPRPAPPQLHPIPSRPVSATQGAPRASQGIHAGRGAGPGWGANGWVTGIAARLFILVETAAGAGSAGGGDSERRTGHRVFACGAACSSLLGLLRAWKTVVLRSCGFEIGNRGQWPAHIHLSLVCSC
jgi:hypothetical protein